MILNKEMRSRQSIEKICRHYEISRQAFYKRKKVEMKQWDILKTLVQKVLEYRKKQPRCGVRKLQTHLRRDGVKIGRDKLFDLLRAKGLLVKPKKAYRKTTNSNHRFRMHRNLIKDTSVLKPGKVLVSDITYIRTMEGFSYLALITDLCSRRIVGYDFSNSLSVEGSLRALKHAIRSLKDKTGTIHHSDRGIQYCCHAYTKVLKRNKMKISMTEENHVYENATAERVNGILKNEFNLDYNFVSRKSANIAVKNAIKIYNSERLHMSLKYKTPNEVHFAA